MAEYVADPVERENPRLRYKWGNGPECLGDVCGNCDAPVIWNPKDLRWEHYQTWEVSCSVEAIKAKARGNPGGRLLIPKSRRN